MVNNKNNKKTNVDLVKITSIDITFHIKLNNKNKNKKQKEECILPIHSKTP